VQRKERHGLQGGHRSPGNARHEPRPVLFAVEDDLPTLELLRDVAADAGWAAHGFTQLSEFERAVAQLVPDLVILDDDLPDGRGGDRARQLRGDRRLRNVPVLVCTAASPPRQAEIGAWVPVVSKPFDLGEIERILDVVARRRGPPVHGAAG
jgi:DNA-binding response OmpR family regulator